MANRLIRNTVILLKPEVTYGTDPTPAGAANALLVSNLSINPLNVTTVDRDLIRSYLGASETLLGARYVEMGFDLELSGAGTVATAPGALSIGDRNPGSSPSPPDAPASADVIETRALSG